MLIRQPVAKSFITAASSLYPQFDPSSYSLCVCVFVHQGVSQLAKKMWLLRGLRAKFLAANSFMFSHLLLEKDQLLANAAQYVCMHCKAQINRRTLIDESFEV